MENNKIFKGHQCLCIIKDDKYEECIINGIKVEEEEKIVECPHLKEWRRWVAYRKKHPPPDCALDLSRRIVKEQQEWIEFGRQEEPIWSVSLMESIRCDPEIRLTNISHPTHLPRPAQIRIPDAIVEELGPINEEEGIDITSTTVLLERKITTIPETLRDIWMDNTYRRNIMLTYGEEMRAYCSHFVTQNDASCLAIIGQKLPMEKPPPVFDMPQIVLTECEDEQELPTRQLIIETDDDPLYFTFIREINMKNIYGYCKNYLELSNTSCVCIHWRFIIIDEDQFIDGRFVVGNPEGSILPGQTCKIPIWFYARRAGYYICNYIVRFNPKVLGSLYVNLIGIATYDDDYALKRIVNVREYIERRVKERVINHIVNELINRIRPILPERPEYRTLFQEMELFEYINPYYKYHLSHILTLKKVYSNLIANDEFQKPWDLSIVTLRELILAWPNYKEREKWFKNFSSACQAMSIPCLEISKTVDDRYRKRILCSLAIGLAFEKMDKQAHRLRKWLICKTRRPWVNEKPTIISPSFLTLTGNSSLNEEFYHQPSPSNENYEDTTSIDEFLSINQNMYHNFCPLTQYNHMFFTSTYFYLCEAIDQVASILQTYQLFEGSKERKRVCCTGEICPENKHR